MEKYLKYVESSFTVFAIIHYSANWLPLILSGGASEGDGTDINSFDFRLNVLLFLLTYLVSVALLLLRWKKFLIAAKRGPVIWVMILIAIASYFWSDFPARTLKSCIGLIGTTLFGIYLGSRYTLREQLKLLSLSYGIIAVLSFLFAIALPRYGIEQAVHYGAWRGIYNHKNLLGRGMTLGGIVLILSPGLFEKGKRWMAHGAIVIACLLLVMAKSSSSLINFTVLFTSIIAYRVLRFRYILLIPSFLAIVTLGGTIFYIYTENIDEILGLIGKDPTLTGRTELWVWAREMIEKRPYLGYGYTAFWQGLDSASAYIIRSARWPVPYSHNGILDMWLDIGLLGVITYFLGFTINLLRAVFMARFSVGIEYFWPLIFLTYLLLTNATEGGIISQNSIFWVLYTALSISIMAPIEKPKPSHPQFDASRSSKLLPDLN
ncbi:MULTISPECIES: O-antigen ligase family protein [Limnospira]|uniref:O-antigen ligase family protein n=1 Tax=Limnospira TaxID=2596745 RepID=UPI0001C38DDD|nr:polymerase [Arthrospira platensis str. Paraca]MDT9310566.1 O-antigen ligase [Limnospira sp. Paracas R14]